MRLLQYLQEEYINNIQGTHSGRYSGYTEIFKNPTNKELKSLPTNDIRFIVDFKKKNLFVWQADVVHYEVSRLLKNDKIMTNYIDTQAFWKSCFAGVAERIAGVKMIYKEPSDYMKLYISKDTPWLNKAFDDEWLSKWFIESSFIETVKTEEQLDLLDEEYVTRVGDLKNNEVFINPTKKELSTFDTVRYVIDFKSKKLYVWEGYIGVHADIINHLYKEHLFPYNWAKAMEAEKTDLSTGTGIVKGGKIEYEDSDALQYGGTRENYGKREWFSVDDKWLDQYFTKSYIKTVVEKLKSSSKFKEYFK